MVLFLSGLRSGWICMLFGCMAVSWLSCISQDAIFSSSFWLDLLICSFGTSIPSFSFRVRINDLPSSVRNDLSGCDSSFCSAACQAAASRLPCLCIRSSRRSASCISSVQAFVCVSAGYADICFIVSKNAWPILPGNAASAFFCSFL